jgi:hypothetical protein
MTRNEITGLMRDAGFDNLPEADYWYPSFKHFAKLVAQHEREACAKVCDKYAGPFNAHRIGECADAIRARNK